MAKGKLLVLRKNAAINPKANYVWRLVCKNVKKVNRKWKYNNRRCSRRIRSLAKPLNPRRKHNTEEAELPRRRIQLVREVIPSTRTEQLALTRARILLQNREEFKNVLSPVRYEIFNFFLRKSYLGLYSRLANVKPPEPKQPVRRWTAKDWDLHKKWLSKKALPKKTIPPPKILRKKVNLSELIRMEILAMPKNRIDLGEHIWKVSQAAMKYVPTEKILALAVPKTNLGQPPLTNWIISPDALTYKITDRIKDLAQARMRRKSLTDAKENPYSVIPNALKAKPTARIKELATAKDYPPAPKMEQFFSVKPSAFKGKASPRTIELAQPKVRK